MDNAALVKRRDSRASTGRAPAVPAKAKAAIAVLLEQPEKDLQAAAQAAGLTTELLRKYLKLSHVRRYYIAERQVILDATCAGNIIALKRIRDDPSNKMASVAAVRGLELMRNEQDEGRNRGAALPAPGVVIVIEAPNGQTLRAIGPPAPVIEGRAEEIEAGYPFRSPRDSGLSSTPSGHPGISAHHCTCSAGRTPPRSEGGSTAT
jgi:hypothetical protein